MSLFFKKFLSEDLPEYLITAKYPPSIVKIFISELEGFGALFLLNFNMSISSNFWNKEIPFLANQVEISFLNNEDNFSDQDWKNLYKLSEDTFVGGYSEAGVGYTTSSSY